jgi:ATP-dependent DNA helicase RecG
MSSRAEVDGGGFDLTPFLTQDEGQHYDRKSLYEGEPGAKRPRDRRAVRDQVAAYVSAFANAEGGVLVLGLEDEGDVTGHALPPDALAELLRVPERRLRPAQPRGFEVEHAAKRLVVFDVPASDVPVQVEGDGFFRRMGDKTVAATEAQILALKFHGFAESWEARPSPLAPGALDPALLAEARRGAGHPGWTDEAYLLRRKLADLRGPNLVLRRAAELVFAKDGPEHPNASVRVFRVIGSAVQGGTRHNVEERPRIEGNLPSVLRRTFAEIASLVRQPSRLVGTRFRTVPEYPEFAWKEAILNAVAHRDYAVEGRTTEAWFFDDRLEVRSPGGLVASIDLKALLALERVHASRNPRTARALVDLGLMREQGEGIPRMFAEMADRFLPVPEIDARLGEVRVVLRNTPTLTGDDQAFLARLGDLDVSDAELRALLEARRRGRVENGRLREIAGLDTLAASALLRKLRDRGLLALHAAGSASYYTLGPRLNAERSPDPRAKSPDLSGKSPDLTAQSPDLSGQSPDLTPQSPDLAGQSPDLPADLRALLARLGKRTRRDDMREAVLGLCRLGPMSAVELAAHLGRRPEVLVRDYLRPLVRAGLLTLDRAHAPNDPRQRYVAARPRPTEEP